MVIAVCRISTTTQEIESQKAELKQFILADGISEKDITWIEGIGASAIKEDDKFRKNITKVNELVESGSYSTVYAWELSRLARRKVTLDLLVEHLKKYKVQLKIKQPSLTLLNYDGSVNAGMEIALTLFGVLAEQEMFLKKERQMRAKKLRWENGFRGSGYAALGYNQFKGITSINEEQARLVKWLFQKYSEGTYSTRSLANEFNQQFGLNYKGYRIGKILNFKPYYNNTMGYQPIISEELFLKCQEILKKKQNPTKSNDTLRHYFLTRLIRCPKCGSGYTAGLQKGRHLYTCSKCQKGRIDASYLDGLAWKICKTLEYNSKIKDFFNKKEIANKRALLEEKIKNVELLISKRKDALERLKSGFLEGLFDMNEFKNKSIEISNEIKRLEKDKIKSQEELEILSQSNDEIHFTKFKQQLNNLSLEEMEVIVRKWIRRAEYFRDEHLIVFHIITDKTLTFEYTASNKKGSKFKVDGILLGTQKLVRADNDFHFEDIGTLEERVRLSDYLNEMPK